MTSAADLLNSLGIYGPNIIHAEQGMHPDGKHSVDDTWDGPGWCVCRRTWSCEAKALGDLLTLDAATTGTLDEWALAGALLNVDRETDERAVLPSTQAYTEKARRVAVEYARLAETPTTEEAHKPGDPHRYRTQCRDCGVFGSVVLSIEPQRAGEPSDG